ncbi:MAG: 3-deoxy-7-phosphoheptulonate synthase [Planctomycetes bacterium]|nr:3-deoxy-7-phosphoheptulonate synthase [Planctomycetota bacterium]MBI3844888.1 3-deoxy-7-phosphoheptulonate synthase [Planctomycetota bacterium]
MIIVLKPEITPEEQAHLIQRIEEMGFKIHLSRGEHRTIVGVIGDEEALRSTALEAFSGVEKVVPILKPYKLASREFRHENTVIDVRGVKIGGPKLVVIAGPCSIESRESLLQVAKVVKDSGATMLRGGAFKPRTSPYSFQGLGEEGLKYLREASEIFDLPVVTEVMDPRQVPIVERYADVLQIGARNMQNYSLLSEVGRTRKPVFLKRGMSATVKDLLLSAEYVLSAGNRQVILCERGVKGFEDSVRNLLDLSAVPNLRGLTHLPIAVDPSHATGRVDLVAPLARAAVVVGADAIMLEVHTSPEKALSDGAQALRPEALRRLMREIAVLEQSMDVVRKIESEGAFA